MEISAWLPSDKVLGALLGFAELNDHVHVRLKTRKSGAGPKMEFLCVVIPFSNNDPGMIAEASNSFAQE